MTITLVLKMRWLKKLKKRQRKSGDRGLISPGVISGYVLRVSRGCKSRSGLKIIGLSPSADNNSGFHEANIIKVLLLFHLKLFFLFFDYFSVARINAFVNLPPYSQ